jgi:hypothetical protein
LVRRYINVAFVRRNECVPYEAGSRPIPVTHDSTIRAYCRVDRCRESCIRLGNKYLVEPSSAASIQFSIEPLVREVISNRTGRRVFCCIIVALELTWPPLDTSDTRIFSKSQALSLLSIARLNSAISRRRFSLCRRIRIDQISCRLSGCFWPINLPLFQGARFLPCSFSRYIF